MASKAGYTPMMQHYLDIKEKNPEAIIMYRLGDFYEMFFEDAKIVSNELDLTLTGRNGGSDEKIPMCGVPYHAVTSYIQRLIQKGYKVAIVEQLESAEEAGKELVKRDIVKIVTPGTMMEEASDDMQSVFIASIIDKQYAFAIVLCEMTTGEMYAQTIEKSPMALRSVLLANSVKEVLIDQSFEKKYVQMIENTNSIRVSYYENDTHKKEYDYLLLDVQQDMYNKAFTKLVNYLDETQRRNMSHLQVVSEIAEKEYLQMDFSTKQNLELTQSLQTKTKKDTLWDFLDHTQSALGSRLLKWWITHPLLNQQEIEERQDMIAFINQDVIAKDELKEHLQYVYDLERLSARIAYGNVNPRDYVRLAKTLEHAPAILKIFQQYQRFENVDDCHELFASIHGIFLENVPVSIKDGNIFVDGYHQELDELRALSNSGQAQLLDIEAREKERTQISSLKVGYSRVFGYYIEVRKANLDKIKEEYGYVRKQTLANVERFVTEELKAKEDAILHAEEKKLRLEQALFAQLIEKTKPYLSMIHKLANALAMIDTLYGLSVVSSQSNYVKPKFHKNHSVYLEEARHPILERTMKQKRYVSNSLYMNEEDDIFMITGPNMGGKSTFMRQTALIVIMAQLGCFVPAKQANLPIFDRIFTRIGASDDIMSGQSTFMVEMMEANNALQHATKHSLILFDEIGRGTSTYDGMALAQAMMEYITQNIKAKTLFSTHYHELTQMQEQYPSIKNVHVEVHEEDDHVTFLYRMLEGKADKSYGINVARLAKLPDSVLARAKQLLAQYEQEEAAIITAKEPVVMEKEHPIQKEIMEYLKMIDINTMTPMDALQFISDMKQKLDS